MVFAIDMAQQPIQHIKHDDRSGIADMGMVIDRRAANIHADIGRVDWHKFLLVAGQRIVKAHIFPQGGLALRLMSGYWDQDKTAPASENAS